MARFFDEWPRVRERLPRDQKSAALANRGGSVIKLSAAMLPDPNGYAPAEAIVGAYEVDDRGRPTGWFFQNPVFGQSIGDDWEKLETFLRNARASVESDAPDFYWWMGSVASEGAREGVAQILDRQIPGTVLEWIKVLEPPQSLIALGRQSELDGKSTVRSVGVIFEFAAGVHGPSIEREFFRGCFTWVATRLDRPGEHHHQTWFDPRLELTDAVELLEERIHFRPETMNYYRGIGTEE